MMDVNFAINTAPAPFPAATVPPEFYTVEVSAQADPDTALLSQDILYPTKTGVFLGVEVGEYVMTAQMVNLNGERFGSLVSAEFVVTEPDIVFQDPVSLSVVLS